MKLLVKLLARFPASCIVPVSVVPVSCLL